MGKKKGILSVLSGAGGKKSGSSRSSKPKAKTSSSKGKSSASKSKSKTKTVSKSSKPEVKNIEAKSKGQTKKPSKPTASGKNKTSRRVSQFRYPKPQARNVDSRHPQYVYKIEEDDMIMLAITHDRNNSNSSKLRQLEANPAPNDKEKAKINKKAKREKAVNMGPRLKGWGFKTKKDRETVNQIIKENNKKGV